VDFLNMNSMLTRRKFLISGSVVGFATASLPFLHSAETDQVPISGIHDDRLRPLDELMVGFVTKHKLPGASLAVGRGGRVLYARGFGFADVDAKKPVRPESLFRLASISKSITGVAVMRAVEQGWLDLDDKILRWFPELVPAEIPDARWRDITLRHLLQHTGGWDRDRSFDAMFRAVPFATELGVDPPAKPEHIIRVMLKKPLDFAPDERYAYSNFGYCLLGRVLERLDGVSYFESVRRRVLGPLCLQRLCLGRTLKEFAHPDEVTYYGTAGATGPSVFAPNVGQQVPWPYGAWHLEAMDAHGGWIGSASDLVRLAMSLDPQACCPLLSADGLKTMWARPSGLDTTESKGLDKDVHYGLGWFVRTLPNDKINVWHTGSLDGTSTIFVRRHDGFCWAVLFNSRSGFNPESMKYDVTPSKAIDGLVHQAVDAVNWP
jgi:N-acyl-D-amino-acid deacylase